MTDEKVIPLPDAKEVDATAAHWIMRLENASLPAAELAEFKAWCGESEQHLSAFNRLSRLWGGLDRLSDLNDLAAAVANSEALTESKGFTTHRWIPRIAIGAMAASFIGASLFTGSGLFFSQPADLSARYQTAVGEQETIALPDGSEIILNTASLIDVEYSRGVRKVYLKEGEAFFEVASDPDRPFSVDTEKGTVTAIGTAFNVHVRDSKIDIVVTEGRVALETAATDVFKPSEINTAAPSTIEVAAGQSASFAENVAPIREVEPDNLERQLDWRDGIIALNGAPLEQVVADISRYTDMSIEIVGEDLRQQPVGGYFKIGETNALFDALHIMADIEIERISEKHVRLYRVQ